jgi:hypothetical protein
MLARQLYLGVVVLMVASSLSTATAATQESCSGLLKEFLLYTSVNESAPYTGSNMLFFLHIPRTAGGTLNCLLRAAVPPQQRCPSAYKALPDSNKLNNCTFVASHDDFSALHRMPAGTAVISELRHPVDPVLSAYEFTIEQAAQRINRTKHQTSDSLADVMAIALTEDVWP